jgi:hypothetical protein
LNNLLNDSSLKQDLNFLIGNMSSKLGYINFIQSQLKQVKTELEQYKK